MKIVNVQQMRAFEQRADAPGNTYAQMMERAGTLCAHALMTRWQIQNQRVLVLVGPGNNGGDGLVCARVLHDYGARVRLYIWKRALETDDVNWQSCQKRHIEFTRADADTNFSKLKSELAQAAFIVDALLGTGVSRPLEGTLKELLLVTREARHAHAGKKENDSALNSLVPSSSPSSSPSSIIAIDLPTGLNPDTGALDPAALHADLTVTFAFPKIGHFVFPGAEAVGELLVADIGIPEAWAQEIALDVATAQEIRARLPQRARNSNKGTFGKAMLACGSLYFTGAPILAARAAGRVGAGLVTVAAPESIHPILAAKIDEATFLPLPDRWGDWRPRAATELLAQIWDAEYDALLVGCGMGQSEGAGNFLERLLENFNALEHAPALVLDADALNLLAAMPEWWNRFALHAPPILTPHPGEMARLLDSTVAHVQSDRVKVARDAARQMNAIIVLKGAFTVIAAPDGRVTLMPFANPALATAGTGDVLAGAIAGFAAQLHAVARRAEKMDAPEIAYQAALVGAYVHGFAGEIAAREIGSAGVVAGDLLPRLPQAIRNLVASYD